MEERNIKDREQAKRSGGKKTGSVASPVAGYIRMTVNGESRELMIGKDIQPSDTLAHTLRTGWWAIRCI